MQIKVPTKWSDVTVKQFEELVSVSNDRELTIAEREIKIISILTGLSIKEIRNLDAPSFQNISNSLIFLNSKPVKSMPKSTITLNNKEYHVDLYVKDYTAAQFLDYKVIAGEEIDKKSSRMLACFIYPVNSKYNDGTYDIEDVVNDIDNYMTVPEVTSYTNFFMIQYVAYATSLLAYSEHQVKKLKETPKQEKKEILKRLADAKVLIKSFGTLE